MSQQPSFPHQTAELFKPSKPAIFDFQDQWRPGLAIVLISVRRSLLNKRFIVLGFIGLLPVVVAVLWRILQYWIKGDSMQFMPASDLFTALMGTFYVWLIWPLISLWLGAAALREEVEDDTIAYLLLRPVSRTTLVIAKTIGAAFTAWLVISGSVCLTYLTIATHPNSGLFPGEVPLLIRDLGVAGLACWAYVGVFAGMGAIFKRPYSLGIAFIIIVDSLIAFVPGRPHFFTIKFYIRSLYSHSVELVGGNYDMEMLMKVLYPGELVGPGMAIFALCLFGILGMIVAIVILYRKEYMLDSTKSIT